ncbi:MAG: hypothetical protein ACO1OF_04805 [Adhaeribacter sp.]
MEQSTLKYLRLLIPGLIFILGIYPIYNIYFSDLFGVKSIDFGYVTILALIVGGIYYQLNIQRIITKPSHYFITRNIRHSLINISGLTLSDFQKNKIRKEKKYMNIFYNLLDNDESLKRKAANVYFNGIFWTSTADSFLINFLFYFTYKYEAIDVPGGSKLSKLFLVLAFFSVILHIISVIKHINLSNEQFKYIKTHKTTEVNTKMNGIL